MSLMFMCNYLASHAEIDGKKMHYMVHNKRGSILAQMRQSQLESAIENKATHLLWVDSDQTFPRDLVHRLLERKKQVVAANVATKVIPAAPTARMRGETLEGTPLYTTPESTGVVQVWRIGTGVMLIDMNIFKRKELVEGPWFSQYWNTDLGSYVGEDWAFCDRLEEAGVKIYVDQDVSKEVGHLGILEYGHDLVVPEELKNVSGYS
jgi:hypothetical protein